MKQFRASATWPEADEFWRDFGGRLTSVGHLQHLQLGRALRRRYVGRNKLLQLDDPALPSWVHAVTSKSDRTLASAQSFLLGLLPHTGQCYAVENELSKQHLAFQGITIHIADVRRPHTPLLHGFKGNPRYSLLRRTAYARSPLLREWAQQAEYQELLQLVSRMCGLTSISPESPEESLQHFMSLTQQINIERSLKIEIFGNQDGTHLREADERRILRVSDHLCHLRYQGLTDDMQKEMSRHAAGLLPNAIVEHFEDAIVGASSHRFVLYSAHDNTLMALLAHLGLKNWPVPHFAALLLFELVETPDGFEVKVAYNADPTDPYGFAEFTDQQRDPLEGDVWLRLPLQGGFRDFADACVLEEEAAMGFDAFRDDLLGYRHSFRTEDEWRAAAGCEPAAGAAAGADRQRRNSDPGSRQKA